MGLLPGSSRERAGARLRCEFHGVGPESGSERLVAALEDDHDDDLLTESGVVGIDNLATFAS